MKNSYDAIVIGMGPSGIFLAYELIELKKAKNILLIDQGKRVEDRNCPLEKVGKCVKCKPFCSITCGFSGAGAFSDGKLSLYNDEDDDIYVGGILHEYIGVENTKRLIDYTDEIYLKFGADKKLEGVDYKEQVSKIKEKSTKQGINLINIPIRHLGTEKAHELYKKLEDYLAGLVKRGYSVTANVIPVYSQHSYRPDAIFYFYTVNDCSFTVLFPNESTEG